MGLAVKVENVSKAYQLGQFNTGALSQDLERWWALVRGKEDPFLKIGETNDRSVKGSSNIVWSLKDINLEIEQGGAVGIIGKNGAGKSTLLKILSRVTSPTSGIIRVKGRMASLLEVGTGFHPELTGRENIFLNGAILGMRKREIKKQFDEIVDFAGIERYIDTPVKRYSSGMYVRLAFAVAAHLESEILIVDEVLAVGDAEFQKKCLGKMGNISRGEGKTVLFVSHNMNSVANLCKRSIVLDRGMISMTGDTQKAIEFYRSSSISDNVDIDKGLMDRLKRTTGSARISNFCGIDLLGNESWFFGDDEPVTLGVSIKCFDNIDGLGIYIALESPSSGEIVTNCKAILSSEKLKNQSEEDFVLCVGKEGSFRPGEYNLYVALANPNFTKWYDVIDKNVNLPSLVITSPKIDPHYHSGFFNVSLSVEKRNEKYS